MLFLGMSHRSRILKEGGIHAKLEGQRARCDQQIRLIPKLKTLTELQGPPMPYWLIARTRQ